MVFFGAQFVLAALWTCHSLAFFFFFPSSERAPCFQLIIFEEVISRLYLQYFLASGLCENRLHPYSERGERGAGYKRWSQDVWRRNSEPV